MLPIRDINPTRSTPFLTYGLIVLNILVFFTGNLLAMLGIQGLGFTFGVVPARFVADPLLELPTIVSSMFLHASFGHLAGNMLFLYIFGDNIEDALGRPRFALFYALSGAAGALAQVLIDPLSQVPMVGASGAIAGVLGAYLVLFPKAKVLILNTIPPLWFILGFTFFAPAWLVLGFWFLVQNLMPALGELAGFGGSQVAFFAHLGGFILGLLLIRPFTWGRSLAKVERWDGWRRAPEQGPPLGTPRQANPPANPRVRVIDVTPNRFDGRWGE